MFALLLEQRQRPLVVVDRLLERIQSPRPISRLQEVVGCLVGVAGPIIVVGQRLKLGRAQALDRRGGLVVQPPPLGGGHARHQRALDQAVDEGEGPACHRAGDVAVAPGAATLQGCWLPADLLDQLRSPRVFQAVEQQGFVQFTGRRQGIEVERASQDGGQAQRLLGGAGRTRTLDWMATLTF